MSSPNYPPKTCALEGCARPLVRHNASPAEWARRKYCSLACSSAAQRTPIEHGTPFGAQKHRRRGETPCDPCVAAAVAYQGREAGKLRAQARRTALARLEGMFPNQFDELFRRELERLGSTSSRGQSVRVSQTGR